MSEAPIMGNTLDGISSLQELIGRPTQPVAHAELRETEAGEVTEVARESVAAETNLAGHIL